MYNITIMHILQYCDNTVSQVMYRDIVSQMTISYHGIVLIVVVDKNIFGNALRLNS